MTLKSIFCLRLREGGPGSGPQKPGKSVDQTNAARASAHAAYKSAKSAANRAVNSADKAHDRDTANPKSLDKANAAINKSNAAGAAYNKAADAHIANIQAHLAYYRSQSHHESDHTKPAPTGIVVPNWFWGAAEKMGGPRRHKEVGEPTSAKPKKPEPAVSAHAPLHPIIEACARLGLRTQKKECVSGSTNTASLVKSKESKMKINAVRFLESIAQPTQETKFRVVLLEEGLGNLHDAFYYTREALESAVGVFNGLKIFADHPSLEEEEIRPERSTRDILGHYENVKVEDGDAGKAWLCGDLSLLPSDDCGWARDLMVRAIENAKKFPDTPFIGLSINAGGDASKTPIDDVIASAPDGAKEKLIEAKDNGIDTVKVVQKITRGTSCDLVTEAGAGGKILNIIGDKDGEEKAG